VRFIIDGTTYAADDIGDLTLRDTLAMAKQAGMGVHTWQHTLGQISRLAAGPDGVVVLSPDEAKSRPQDCDPDLFMDSEPHLRAFLVMVWLARRTAGQPTLTFDESNAVAWRSLEFIADEPEADEPDEAPDPTSLPGSAADDGSDLATSSAS
jgi:hypothetical protein